MMNKINNLELQIKKVLALLNYNIKIYPNKLILKTLYEKYVNAEKILLYNGNMSDIKISGGCRAYLDAFSDYTTPLFIEMDKAEMLFEKIIKTNN